MAYTDQKEYLKFLKKKCSEHEAGCDDCSEQECTCCPPGLVEVSNENGKHIACLTPNDAELFTRSVFTCQPGYVVLAQTIGGKEIMSCVPSDEFAALYAAINP